MGPLIFNMYYDRSTKSTYFVWFERIFLCDFDKDCRFCISRRGFWLFWFDYLFVSLFVRLVNFTALLSEKNSWIFYYSGFSWKVEQNIVRSFSFKSVKLTIINRDRGFTSVSQLVCPKSLPVLAVVPEFHLKLVQALRI